MSHVIAAPEMMTAAAADIATMGSTLDVAHAAAALPTVGLAPAAADEVSGSIAQVFSAHAQEYQALARQATAYHEQFAQTLAANSASYASAEIHHHLVVEDGCGFIWDDVGHRNWPRIRFAGGKTCREFARNFPLFCRCRSCRLHYCLHTHRERHLMAVFRIHWKFYWICATAIYVILFSAAHSID
jgi:hypothetical protein